MNKKNKFLEDNLIYFLIPIIVLAAGLYFIYVGATTLQSSLNAYNQNKTNFDSKQKQLNSMREKNQREAQKKEEVVVEKKESVSGKIIYEVLDQQFSPEASFGVMFEDLLANLTNNGVRVRAIDYNYSPQNDKIIMAGNPGYNAAELTFTTVATYSQFQNFLKSIAKEKHLVNIQEVYIEPYDKDKTILIITFKIRLYTKSVM